MEAAAFAAALAAPKPVRPHTPLQAAAAAAAVAARPTARSTRRPSVDAEVAAAALEPASAAFSAWARPSNAINIPHAPVPVLTVSQSPPSVCGGGMSPHASGMWPMAASPSSSAFAGVPSSPQRHADILDELQQILSGHGHATASPEFGHFGASPGRRTCFGRGEAVGGCAARADAAGRAAVQPPPLVHAGRAGASLARSQNPLAQLLAGPDAPAIPAWDAWTPASPRSRSTSNASTMAAAADAAPDGGSLSSSWRQHFFSGAMGHKVVS